MRIRLEVFFFRRLFVGREVQELGAIQSDAVSAVVKDRNDLLGQFHVAHHGHPHPIQAFSRLVALTGDNRAPVFISALSLGELHQGRLAGVNDHQPLGAVDHDHIVVADNLAGIPKAQDIEELFEWVYDSAQDAPFHISTVEAPHYRRYWLQRKQAEVELARSEIEFLEQQLEPFEFGNVLQRAELLGDHQRRMVGQHDAARSEADRVGVRRHVRQNRAERRQDGQRGELRQGRRELRRDRAEIRAFAGDQGGTIVLKPLQGSGGASLS